jgi:hypothetical protein
MFMPSPGNCCPSYVTALRVNRMSASWSFVPYTFAHQHSDVPQPSQVPQLDCGFTVIV